MSKKIGVQHSKEEVTKVDWFVGNGGNSSISNPLPLDCMCKKKKKKKKKKKLASITRLTVPLIRCRLNRLPHYILEESNFNFRYVRLWNLEIPREKWLNVFAKSGDPDQTPRSVASDLGLRCLLITGLGVSRLQWVNQPISR